MQWDSSENAGFSKGTPWLPVPPTYKTHNVADEIKRSEFVLEFYRRCSRCGTPNQALLDGNYTALNESDPNVISYVRIYKGRGVVVAMNMSDVQQKVSLDLKGKGFSSTKKLLASGLSGAKGEQISLEPYGVYVGELTK